MQPIRWERRATRELDLSCRPPQTPRGHSLRSASPHTRRVRCKCSTPIPLPSLPFLFYGGILPPLSLSLPPSLECPTHPPETEILATNHLPAHGGGTNHRRRRRCWRRSLFCSRTPLAGGTPWTSPPSGRIGYSTSSPLSTASSPPLLSYALLLPRFEFPSFRIANFSIVDRVDSERGYEHLAYDMPFLWLWSWPQFTLLFVNC